MLSDVRVEIMKKAVEGENELTKQEDMVYNLRFPYRALVAQPG